MTRKSLLPLLPLLSGLALIALSSDHALARGYGEDSSLPLFDNVVDWIGFRDTSGDKRDLFLYVLIGFAFSFGYLTDLAFKDRGFGKILNGLVGIVGICVALHFAWPRIGELRDASEKLRFNLAMIAGGAGAALALFFTAVIKGYLMRRLRLGIDKFDQPAKPKPIAVDAPLDPRIATALREKI